MKLLRNIYRFSMLALIGKLHITTQRMWNLKVAKERQRLRNRLTLQGRVIKPENYKRIPNE
jgi:hypothetical protein